MKRFWLVLLSLGLIMAFSASAFAVDVKFSGEYYVAGMYVNRVNLNDTGTNGQSTAFYFQRLRLQTNFVVSPGLELITRADIMERAWGAPRSNPSKTLDPSGTSAGTDAENENIAFDYAYLQYATPVGLFRAGVLPGGAWGTVFGDSRGPRNRLYYNSPALGGFTLVAIIEKNADNSYYAKNLTATQTDKDTDTYYLACAYANKMVNVGLLYGFQNNAAGRVDPKGGADKGAKAKLHNIYPYAFVNVGPVKIQSEVDWTFGKMEYDNGTTADVDFDSLAGWVDATADFGPVYVGASFAYARGDVDPTDNLQYGAKTGGIDYSPTLIMWNEYTSRWFGALNSTYAPAGFNAGKGLANAWLYQGRVGVKPIEKLDIMASLSFAQADKTPDNYVSKDYGYEIDVTGTYKITNNLSYMLGVGYLLTGDYFKGTNSANEVANDYLVINKLTLTF